MKKIKKTLKVFLIGIVAYLAIGHLLHRVIFPEKIPDISTYFQPGDVFKSEYEGLTQTVIKQENGLVWCKVELAPHADGPPLHIHTSFDENFESGDKAISLVVNQDTMILQPGESYHIPKGTPHKPFNHTHEHMHLSMDKFAFPEEFAFYLNQVYGYLDESPENMKPPKILLQMALFTQRFDSYLAYQAPPVFMQKTMYFIMAPIARLLGYRSYYEKYDIKP